MDWKLYVDAVLADISAARTGPIEEALEHLRDARLNLEQAIEALDGD